MSDRLPSRDAILAFIRDSTDRPGKREIARAFKIKGADRVDLKQMLADMAEEGLIAKEGGKRFSDGSPRLPPVTIVSITHLSSDGELVAQPTVWKHTDTPAPRVVFAQARKGDPTLGIGDRVLAKLRALGKSEAFDYEARPIRKLQSERRALGVFRAATDGEGGRIVPVEKKQDRELLVEPADTNGAQDGELVEAEVLGGPRYGLPRAKIVERLGDITAPRSISLIAIHEHGIPVEFSDEALAEAAAAKPVTDMKGRDDLRDLPLVTIDPEDARDHDDAVYAEADTDPANDGGHVLYVAIADVAHYVRPGTALDRNAVRRGNSCYFPDRVVPMLPDSLSGDLCSLHEGVERPCLGVRIVLGRDGTKRSHSFFRAMMRSAASLTYEQAQAMADGQDTDAENAAHLAERVVKPLWACYAALVKARERRQPLDLDLPERRVVLNEEGEVASIRFRERLDAHRLIEECMVLANVCAAETLEQKQQELIYRVHEPPLDERIDNLRETLRSAGLSLVKGERIRPSHLNRALRDVATNEFAETINLAVLRAQTQAYYAPENLGHFGLNLARYAHFTSPIRRYADLIVHRALIRALGLGASPKADGITHDQIDALGDTAKQISLSERRAMMAERDSTDRYLAAYMSDRLGAEFDGVVSGIARFGLFVKLDDTGADGLIPISSLGDDFYRYDERTSTLTGARTRRKYRLGQPVRVRLEEAAPLTGGLRFAMIEDGRVLSAPDNAKRGGRSGKQPRGKLKAKLRGKR